MAQQLHRPKLELSVAQHMGQSSRQRQLPTDLGGQAWKPQQLAAQAPRIAFVVTTSDSLQQIRIWISYHKALGVTTFYIFADGQVGPSGVCIRRDLATQSRLWAVRHSG